MPATPIAAPDTLHASEHAPHEAPSRRRPSARPSRPATDDEILGLDASSEPLSSVVIPRSEATRDLSSNAAGTPDAPVIASDAPEPENLRAAFDANPELRRAWQDAHAYRETFATPEEARAATALLADLDRMDALFFSRRPEDHAALARAVADLDPAAFASLAQAMTGLATEAQRRG
jgi:hypothetical protein